MNEPVELQCAVLGCETRGVSLDGGEVFICEFCATEFAKKLVADKLKRLQRHANN